MDVPINDSLNFISLDTSMLLKGFAPIGIMEHWNNGFWKIDGMGYWENQVDKPTIKEMRNLDLIHSVEDEFASPLKTGIL
jgi:hypothetical protein